MGSKLAYSFGRDGLSCCDISKFNVQEDDVVVFCFGEIDCRCQIGKRTQNVEEAQTMITDIVVKYVQAVKLNVENFGKPIRPFILTVTPPVEKNTTHENPQVPFIGTDNERREYTAYFNQKLREECEKTRVGVLDVYHDYADDRGFLKRELSDGHVHIRDERFIQQALWHSPTGR